MNAAPRLRLQVLLPTEILVDTTVSKVIAEAENGAFCLLPRHIDFVAALVPGILLYETEDGAEHLLANDTGVLVKVGDEVRVSTLNAIAGEHLEDLRETVEAHFKTLDEHERLTRTALSRLEAGTLRHFQKMEDIRHGPD